MKVIVDPCGPHLPLRPGQLKQPGVYQSTDNQHVRLVVLKEGLVLELWGDTLHGAYVEGRWSLHNFIPVPAAQISFFFGDEK